MNHFARNMSLLDRRNPQLAKRITAAADPAALAVESARSGEPTARRRDVYLHSPYDPSREADETVRRQAAGVDAARPVTVFGLGLGYHARQLASAGFSGTIIEEDPAVVRAALASLDLSEVVERFDILAGLPADLVRRRHAPLFDRPLLPHPASLRVSPDYLGRLHRYAEALLLGRRGKLKVLVVDPISGGSLPAAHHCSRALRALGHKVIPFESERLAAGMEFAKTFSFRESATSFNAGLASLLSRGVELKARETRPDIVLALAQAPILPETMAKLDKMGIPTAFWFVEDFTVLPYWRDTAPACSYFFGIQKENFTRQLSAIGVTRYAYLPTCAAADVHRPLSLTPGERAEFGSPLSFVGAGYFNRQVFFKGLTDYPFRIWGSDWPLISPLTPYIQRHGARIDTETCVRIFNASAVNLNLHSSTTCDGVAPDGDFVNPRTFEIAACGAFQLVDRRGLLPELFEPGELATFGDLEELREKIDRYLADEPGRQALATQGRERVLAEHTYERRIEELLATMVAEFPAVAARVEKRATYMEELMAELDRHEGLPELLARMPDRRWFEMRDAVASIVTGKGELTRAEKIFLMLQNVEVIWGATPE